MLREIIEHTTNWTTDNGYNKEWRKLVEITEDDFYEMILSSCEEAYNEMPEPPTIEQIDEAKENAINQLSYQVFTYCENSLQMDEPLVFYATSPHHKPYVTELTLRQLAQCETNNELEITHPILPATVMDDLIRQHFCDDSGSVRVFTKDTWNMGTDY